MISLRLKEHFSAEMKESIIGVYYTEQPCSVTYQVEKSVECTRQVNNRMQIQLQIKIVI
jgi:hypothetical protein